MSTLTHDDPLMDEIEAQLFLTSRLWPEGPVCPSCGGVNCYRMHAPSIVVNLPYYRCRPCKKQFTIMNGTPFQDSRVPLNIWLKAMHLFFFNQSEITILEMQYALKIGSYRTAWKMVKKIQSFPKEFLMKILQ